MTGKELLLRAVRGEATPRPAWLPFVGCHGGKLIGKGAAEFLRSADLLVEGLKKAHELYRPDGLPVTAPRVPGEPEMALRAVSGLELRPYNRERLLLFDR